ncbi:MAG: hypothetical protein WB562_02175 [Candidatus Sulfotelmatobacter sp.]
MKEVVTALIGVATGFFLPSLAKFVQSRVRGTRFENAVRAEIEEAKDIIHEKMLWVSRDHREFREQADTRLLVEFDGKLLYLGEEEEFRVALPFWENNIRDIIEITSTKSFNKMCRDFSLAKKFASKFREMKLSFKVSGGDPKQMALACYRDLLAIHDQLIPATS